MPWRELEPMEQRLELIREYTSGVLTMTELVAQYGVSQKTAYKWLARYEAHGVAGLGDRSRRPHQSPHAIGAGRNGGGARLPTTASALGRQEAPRCVAAAASGRRLAGSLDGV